MTLEKECYFPKERLKKRTEVFLLHPAYIRTTERIARHVGNRRQLRSKVTKQI